MSDEDIDYKPKFEYLKRENQMHPALMGVCANLVAFPWISSPTRMYMVGNMIPKSVVTNGASGRLIMTGFEYQYAEGARKIVAPSNMLVEEVFYVQNLTQSGEPTDKWNSQWILFKNDEKNYYDILELPRYNTQNTYVGFEYVYNKDLLRRIEKGATFPKGTEFGKSPRVNNKTNEWHFGMDLVVCAGSFHFTEEDGIAITDRCAYEKLQCMFKHERGYSWNEDEMIPILPYGTDDDPKPFPESGESVRPDGIVMGFRRRRTSNALVSLTKKALRIPDPTHDILFMAPPNSQVMSVEVLSERMKDRSNNRSTDYIDQTHNKLLDRYEKAQNDMWNQVVRWYHHRLAANGGKDIPMSKALDQFIRLAEASWTRSPMGKVNPIFRGNKRVKLKDWNVKILLREMVPGKTKFKMAGMNGDKGVIVRIIPWQQAPRYADGTIADVIVNNTPAFSRQIFSMLLEQGVNFINMNLHKEIKQHYKDGEIETAYAKLLQFFDTGFPEYGELVRDVILNKEDEFEFVEYVAKNQISVHERSDTKLYGVGIIRALREVYSYKPQKIIFTDSLGEEVESTNPVLITHQHFMLLDKFGTDMSAQSLPLSNPFGMPAKPNDTYKYSSFLKDTWNRNCGETEGRLRLSQSGAKEVNKQMAMAYSPELRIKITRRIIRADDPFDIDQIVKEDEYSFNKAIQMSTSMLSDSGYTLRHELDSDRTPDIPFMPADLEVNEELEAFLKNNPVSEEV